MGALTVRNSHGYERCSKYRNDVPLVKPPFREAELPAQRRKKNLGFAQRLRRAIRRFEDRSLGGMTVKQEEFAQAVSLELGKRPAYSGSAVGKWLAGIAPDIETIAAVATVCTVRPGWLAFAEEPMVGTPGAPDVTIEEKDTPAQTMADYLAKRRAELRKQPTGDGAKVVGRRG